MSIMDIDRERLLQIIYKPHLSEKSTILAEKFNQFTFKVAPDAMKDEIKEAVEMLFNVKVDSVEVLNVKGKARRFKQFLGKRKNWKKAYVVLKEGYDIDFSASK